MGIKIGTLNLCLGLANKKNIVKQLIIEEKIDILCLQETELNINLNHDLLSFPTYCFESEINKNKSRVGVYIHQNVNYVRRSDLEGCNKHILIIDIKSKRDLRLITIYRPFNTPDGSQPRDFFSNQLDLIKLAMTNNTILLGDFNLDWNKKNMHTYQFKHYLEILEEKLEDTSLVQIVEGPTWSRVVNGVVRESAIDHIYINNLTMFEDSDKIKPSFGDHKMVYCIYNDIKSAPSVTIRRNWRHYSRDKLITLLNQTSWTIKSDSVQDAWNEIENKLIKIVDLIAPLEEFTNDRITKSTKAPTYILAAKNRRKKLLSRMKTHACTESKKEVHNIDIMIRQFYHKKKAIEIRKAIIPGNSGSLWKAVKVANDVHNNQLPKSLFETGILINNEDVSETFARFFDNKIKDVLADISINTDVYNGTKKVNAENSFFMTPTWVRECMESLKIKNTEGYDRIPQRVLVDGSDVLSGPFSDLFNKIYQEKAIPGQWLISKTIPVYKNKGDKKNIESYRPIANLCSASKVFEKLILRRILEIQELNNCDITGINQHGFKRNRSTSTMSLEIQNIIARALDEDKLVLLASLDLSAAFDVVNIDLLIKRLKIIGLPGDIVELIRIWLKDRMFYVSIDGVNSMLYDLLLGTVQGSILGPVLYAIYISPIFDLEQLFAFADDKFVPKVGVNKEALVKDMEVSLSAIRIWIKQSGLKINENKTEICLFSRQSSDQVTVKIGPDEVVSKDNINVLGVLFDAKLEWSLHIKNAIEKSAKALNALSLIRRYFNSNELLQLVTSNYFSILYYNSEIWHVHCLKLYDKKLLLTASARALKLATHYRDPLISYKNLHVNTKRATPDMYCDYKLSLLLYKTFNLCQPESEWTELNFCQTLMSRQSCFHVNKSNRLKVGLNCLCNRFHHINDKIPLVWLNEPFLAFKLECKKLFLSFNS